MDTGLADRSRTPACRGGGRVDKRGSVGHPRVHSAHGGSTRREAAGWGRGGLWTGPRGHPERRCCVHRGGTAPTSLGNPVGSRMRCDGWDEGRLEGRGESVAVWMGGNHREWFSKSFKRGDGSPEPLRLLVPSTLSTSPHPRLPRRGAGGGGGEGWVGGVPRVPRRDRLLPPRGTRGRSAQRRSKPRPDNGLTMGRGGRGAYEELWTGGRLPRFRLTNETTFFI